MSSVAGRLAHPRRTLRRERRWRRLGALTAAGVVLLLAALLVERLIGGGPDGSARPVEPVRVLAVLGEPPRAVDVPARQPPPGSVHAGSTRYLGATGLGRHYAATSADGAMACLVTVPPEPGEAVTVTCTGAGESEGAADPALITVGPTPRGWVALVRDGGTLPAPWTRAGRNLAERAAGS